MSMCNKCHVLCWCRGHRWEGHQLCLGQTHGLVGKMDGGQVVVVTVIRSVTDTSSGERGGMGFGEEAWALSLTVVRGSDRD